jgi:ribonucleotide monophosphatase NagD (HAD superfamily)
MLNDPTRRSQPANGFDRPGTVPCQSMNLSPAETLYVGDNYRVDIEGARNAGLQALHLTRGGTQRPGTIQSLAELPSLLFGTHVRWPTLGEAVPR